MADVNQIPRRTFPNLDPAFNQHYSQLTDTVNTLLGYYGEVPIQSSLNLKGNKITGVGQASTAQDVLTLESGDSNYSAPVMRAKLEANGSHPLQSVRRLNDTTQREQNSSWLKTLLSTAPSANNLHVLFSTPQSGYTQITIPASLFTFADGEVMTINAYILTVSNPVTLAISSISADGSTATVNTTAALGAHVSPGSYIAISGVTDTNFNGDWQVSAITGTNSFTFPLSYGPATSSGGSVATAGIWYIYINLGDPNPHAIGVPHVIDCPFNRLPASNDQRQLIAVATVTSSGGQSASSAGGGTANSTLNAGSFF